MLFGILKKRKVFFLCLLSVGFLLSGCATSGDIQKLQRQNLALRSEFGKMNEKQVRLLANIGRLQALLSRQNKIFAGFKRKGSFDIANIGENVSQLRTDNQSLRGQFHQLKEKHEALRAQHMKFLKAYAAQFGNPLSVKVGAGSVAPETLFRGAKALFDAKRYVASIKRIKIFLKKHPKHDLSDDAYLLQGDCLLKLNNFVGASVQYNKVRTEFASAGKVDVALLRLGQAHFQMGVCDAGKAYLRRLLSKYQTSSRADEARNLLSNSKSLCKRR